MSWREAHPAICEECTEPATTQVTEGMFFGLYCKAHGAIAEAARMERIAQRNRKARR